MIKKRKVPALLLGLVAGLALTACSGNNGGNANPTSAASETAAPQATEESSELQPYEVSIYMPGGAQKDLAVVEAAINEQLGTKLPNTTVKLNYLDWGAYLETTNLMFQAGEPMDLVFAPEWYQFFTNVAKGAFLPLADATLETHGNLLEQYGQGIKEAIHPTYLQAPVVGGKLYAIPTNKELAQGRGFMFRKDIVEKYNMDIQSVKELEDLEPLLEIVKANEPDIYPLYSNKQDSIVDWLQDYNYQNLGYGAFVNRTDPGSPVISQASDEYAAIEIKNYQVLHDFFQKGYLNKNAATTQEKIDDLKAAGKVWVFSTTTSPGRAEALRIKNTSGSGPEYFEWEIVDIQAPLVTTSQATGSQFAIARSSQDPARAMMVLNLLYTDKELLNTVVHGIQDKHFTKLEDNRIKLIPDSGYSPGNNWIIGNQLINYLLDNEKADKYEEYVKFNETAEQSPLLGFTFNPENVKNQVAAYSSTETEFRDILRTGTVDPADILNKRNEKMKASGLDDIVAEMQKQLDEWKAANGK